MSNVLQLCLHKHNPRPLLPQPVPLLPPIANWNHRLFPGPFPRPAGLQESGYSQTAEKMGWGYAAYLPAN